ncbi:SAM-dependent methyltransferase [Streptomyces sp. T028]|uniref:SAM-dependent methyltransferase n=1 Tax=Streptomyces sp. T028 TaxID=3394379 RepID=UPI003A8A4318
MDFEQPIAITMPGVLNFVMDIHEAVTVVWRLMNAAPSGRHLVISHPTTEVDGEAMTAAVDYWNGRGSAPMTLHSHADLARLFDGVELLDTRASSPAPVGAVQPPTSLTSAASG